MRSFGLKRCFSLLLCIALLLCGCASENPIYELFESDYEKALDASRPEGATALPDFSGEITDVRVTTIPRDLELPDGPSSSSGMDLSGMEFRQIYYGYCVDGVWTDLPCENYELVSIFNPVDYHSGELLVTRGYEAVNDDHMVKIGPYLLISVCARIGKNDTLMTVEDSIDSDMELLFMEYDQWTSSDGKPKYGYIIEDRESILSGWKLKWEAVSNIEARYFILLKYDEIPEDYQLWTKVNAETDQLRSLLTYSDIQSLLSEGK